MCISNIYHRLIIRRGWKWKGIGINFCNGTGVGIKSRLHWNGIGNGNKTDGNERKWEYCKQFPHIYNSKNGPFDVVGGLGEEEALRVGLNDEGGSRVDGQRTVGAGVASALHGDQQQLQLAETQPIHATMHAILYQAIVDTRLRPRSGAAPC